VCVSLLEADGFFGLPVVLNVFVLYFSMHWMSEINVMCTL